MADPAKLVGGSSPQEAKAIFDNVLLDRAERDQKEVVIANAAFAIQVLDQEKNIDECADIARESIESGKAWRALKKFVEVNS